MQRVRFQKDDVVVKRLLYTVCQGCAAPKSSSRLPSASSLPRAATDNVRCTCFAASSQTLYFISGTTHFVDMSTDMPTTTFQTKPSMLQSIVTYMSSPHPRSRRRSQNVEQHVIVACESGF
nr:hypothetical protein CFP56_57903 [Quercus suber]